MIKLKIDVTKIDKSRLFVGAKGTYLDLALFENKDGKGEYGDDGFIVQEVTKEKREAGIKGPIIGNWRHFEVKGRDVSAQEATRKSEKRVTNETQPDEDCSDVPF